MVQDAINQPDYKTTAYNAMSPAWKVVTDVSAGTPRLREAGSEYLPQEPAEKDLNYTRRLNRSVFFNAYRRTREALVGLVFKSNPKPSEDVPPEIVSHLENIDLAGSHIDVFAKELFMDSFEGHAFILVDMEPALAPNATRADELATGRRPYWVKYRACQALNWRLTRINGELELVQITFEEKTCEPDGEFGEQEVVRFRVFRRSEGVVTWRLYRRQKSENTQESIVIESEGTTTLSRIPVAIVYGRRVSMMESEPPLLDLAHLNIAHYQEYSDYRNILHVANVPILLAKGVPEDRQKTFQVGPNSLAFADKEGDLLYVEHEGKAIGAARQELMDLEQRMAMMGLSLLSQRSDSDITATEKRQDWQQETSHLATQARSLQDALELALEFHAEYLGLESGGSITLGVADEDLVIDGTLFSALCKATSGPEPLISRETFYAMLQRGFKSIDFEDEEKRVKKMIETMPKPDPVVELPPSGESEVVQ